MPNLTYSELERLTGKTYRTLRKYLSEIEPAERRGRSLLFNPIEALPAIYESKECKERLDLTAERARLASEQADLAARKNAVEEKQLIPAKEVEHVWSGMILNARAKLLALPSKIAPIAAELDDPRKIMVEVKALIYEALNELGTGKKSKSKKTSRKTRKTVA